MPIIVISSQLDKNILTSVLKSSCNLKNSMNNFTINISLCKFGHSEGAGYIPGLTVQLGVEEQAGII